MLLKVFILLVRSALLCLSQIKITATAVSRHKHIFKRELIICDTNLITT